VLLDLSRRSGGSGEYLLPLYTKPMNDCVFCQIVAGEAPAEIVHENEVAVAFVPLGPVTPGHVLVVPRQHVEDALVNPAITATTMLVAAQVAQESYPCNLITSAGHEASQTVFHLHIHVVPRRAGDGLALPWSPR
jgi:histidine triad (HIT) family protein